MGDATSFDRILSPFLAAPSEEEADCELSHLLGELSAPLVQRLVRAQLAGLPAADLEDVAAETQLRLAERLRALRRTGGGEPIASFEAYVVATARNACRAHLRARRPAWTRLSNQVRYLLGHDPALATWRGADGRPLAGLAAWRDRAVAAPAAEAATLALPAAAAELELAALLRGANSDVASLFSSWIFLPFLLSSAFTNSSWTFPAFSSFSQGISCFCSSISCGNAISGASIS